MHELSTDPDATRHQYTVCIAGENTDWIETIWAPNIKDAIEIARRTCADAWELYDCTLPVRFVMAGDVRILYYNDVR
jgi:hypothetical protein